MNCLLDDVSKGKESTMTVSDRNKKYKILGYRVNSNSTGGVLKTIFVNITKDISQLMPIPITWKTYTVSRISFAFNHFINCKKDACERCDTMLYWKCRNAKKKLLTHKLIRKTNQHGDEAHMDSKPASAMQSVEKTLDLPWKREETLESWDCRS